MSSSTKTEIIHTASRMLLSKGFNGFSLQELATELKLNKASLYHHYSSKTALGIALYQFYQSSFLQWAQVHSHLSPEKQILAYVDTLTVWICEKQRVCPVGALSLEWSLVEEELQHEIIKLHTLHKEWLSKLLKEIQKKEKLKFNLNDTTLQIMGLIQGSIQIARINQDSKLVKKNLKSFLKILKG